MARRLLDILSSPRLAVGCLAAAMGLVFAGTLGQVYSVGIPAHSAGRLLGGVLLANLVAAHLRRFGLCWRNAGLHLVHGGLAILLAGGLFADWCSVEGRMQLAPGETRKFSEDVRRMEWVGEGENASGVGHVTVIPGAHLRPLRYGMPYSITLREFTHACYPGTGIPKTFSSRITLADPARGVLRDALISMNHPFRYGGETYYQAGFSEDDRTSILLVVRHPGFAAPYVACGVMGAGLLVQFFLHFAAFMRQSRAAFFR